MARALVTGANRGIGLAVARGLRARGFALSLLRRDETGGGAAREELLRSAPGAGPMTVQVCDLGDLAAVDHRPPAGPWSGSGHLSSA